jgi:hypothetical protein
LGHKLADEMSLLVWSDGRTWITNTGYWPYGDPNRRTAEGWLNGNAPHWIDEPRDSVRRTTLVAHVNADEIVALVLRRSGADGSAFTRQIVAVGGAIWLVVDSAASDIDRIAETLWTFAPDLAITASDTSHYLVGDRNRSMHVSFFGAPDIEAMTVRGSTSPLAGWIAGDQGARPAPAILVHANGRSTHSFSLFEVGSADTRAAMRAAQFDNPTAWSAQIPRDNGSMVIERSGNSIQIVQNGTVRSLTLAPATDVNQAQARIEETVARAAEKYPRYRELDLYRSRLSALVLFGLILQEPSLYALRRFGLASRPILALRLMIVAGWLALGAWGLFVYLT